MMFSVLAFRLCSSSRRCLISSCFLRRKNPTWSRGWEGEREGGRKERKEEGREGGRREGGEREGEREEEREGVSLTMRYAMHKSINS